MTDPLAPYLAAVHRRWLAPDVEQPPWQEVDGTLVFLDISGFTPLTEKLATLGKVGGEELTDHLNTVFSALVGVADEHGGDVLKFGGDALLFLFDGVGHEARAAAAIWDMQGEMGRFRRLNTSAGMVPLAASAGLASGPVYLYLAGGPFKDLIVAGPTVTACLEAEKLAEPTEIRTPDGLLERRPTDVRDPPPRASTAEGDPRGGLPSVVHAELEHIGSGEHRMGVVCFVQFSGLDDLLGDEGPEAAAHEVAVLMTAVTEACERHRITFLSTDADLGAGKACLVAGAPRAGEDDADRMLHAAREIVASPTRLKVRCGVNHGRVFAVDLGAPTRRVYTVMGDATNLAARVMGKAPMGGVLASQSTLEAVRGAFALEHLEPFMVKGKSAPVDAAIVGGPASRIDLAATPTDTALIGRQTDLVTLTALLDVGSGAVELVGEAGIGKSALVAATLAEANRRGRTAMVVEGGAYGAHAPFYALRAPLGRLLGGRDEAALRRGAPFVTEAEDWLGLLGPVLGLDLPLSPRAERLSPDAAALRRRTALAELLSGFAGGLGFVLVVDDAHWLDPASAELLTGLLHTPFAEHCVFVAARRPGDGGLRLPDPPARLIEVGPLGDDESRAIVLAAVDEDGALPPDAVPTLVARGGGNPLVLRELAAAVRAGGDVSALPDTVEAVMAASVDRLPAGDRKALREAAVLGARFDRAVLAGLWGFDGPELDERLARLEHFIVLDGDEVVFRQSLQRITAYEALPFRRRRELHGTAADILLAQHGSGVAGLVELLAIHTHHAGRAADALRWSREAARYSLQRGVPTSAIELLAWAIEAAEELGDGALAEVHEEQGDACDVAGRYGAAGDAYAAARKRTEDPLDVARLWRKQARTWERRGRYDQALACATRGRAALSQAPPGPERDAHVGTLEDVAGWARLRQGRADGARVHFERAVALLENSDRHAELAHACYGLAGATVEQGDFAGARELSERALALYEAAGDLSGASAVLNNLGVDAYWAGDYRDAAGFLERSRALRRDIGDVVFTAETELNLAELRSDQGHWDEAEALLTDALAIFRAAPRPEGAGLATSDLGRLASRRGDHERAGDLLAHAQDLLEGIGAEALALEAHVRIAEHLALSGAGADALAEAELVAGRAAGVPAGHFYGPTIERAAGWALAQLGDMDGARERLALALEKAIAIESLYEQAVTGDALAKLARASGRPDITAERKARMALKLLDVVALPEAPLTAAAPSHAVVS